MVEANTGASCASCGQPLAGRYCAACGEEVLDPHKLTVRHFLTHSLVPELVNLDGRVWRTLRFLLFRPGYLALEYAAGRRRAYVKPLRVLLVAIIVYALSTQSGSTITLRFGQVVLSVAPVGVPQGRSIGGTLDNIDRFGVLERLFIAKHGAVESASDDQRRRFNDILADFVTPLSFASVLLLSSALYLLFRRRRPLFVEHAVFGMHYFSFVLLWTLIAVVFIKLELVGRSPVIFLILFAVALWQAGYLAIALRRFYWEQDRRLLVPWAAAAGVGVALYLLNTLFITAVQFAGGALAIWRL
jgi:hypothetical protein